MPNLGELFFSIVGKDETGPAIASATGRLNKLSGLMTAFAGGVVGGAAFGAMSAAASGVSDFFGSAITSASDAAEEMDKFQQVFKDQGAAGESWVGTTAKEMGRSEGMIRSFAATFGAVLTPMMDGNRKKALELSEGYTRLAVDLSSFANVSEEEAAQAISSAIAGQTEPMRKFGVMLSENAVNAELMAMGLNKTGKEATEAEKQQARYNIIMKATADAQGDAVRTSGGFANSMRAMAARMDELKIKVGTALMPVMLALVQVATGAIDQFIALWEKIGPAITPIIKGVVDTIKGIVDKIKAVFSGGDLLGPAMKFLNPIVTALRDTLMPIVGEVTRFFNEQFRRVADWWKRDGAGIVQAVSGFASALSGTLAKGIEVVGGVFRTYLLPVLEWLAGGVLSIIMDALSSLSGWFNSSGVQNAIRDLAKGFDDWCRALEPVGAAIMGAGKALAEWLEPKLSAAWDAIKGFAAWLGATLYPVLLWIWDTLSKFAQWLGSVFVGIWEALKNPIGAAWEWIKSTVGAAWEWICGLFTGASGGGLDLVAIVGGVWEAIKTATGTAWELIKSAVVTAAGLIWTWLSTEGLRLAGEAVMAIWNWVTENVPRAWDLIKQAVVTAAGIIWNWLKTDGVDLGGKAVKAIWDWICEKVPAAWELIKGAVIAAAEKIWNWMKDTAPGLAVAAIGVAWAAIAGAVDGAWEAIKTAVKTAAQKAWDAAQAIFRVPLKFEIPDIVGAARRAYDAAQRALKGDDSAGPAVAPTAAPGIDINNPVAIAPSGNGGRWVDGHYISPGANGYWDHGTWVPVHHSGGIYEAPGGASEGLALLLDGERVLSPSQTRDYDGGLLSAVQALAAKIDQLGGGSGGDVIVHGDVKLSEDYSYDRFREDVGRWKSSRIAKGVL